MAENSWYEEITPLSPYVLQPGIERHFADTSRLAICYQRNETRASIANPPNSAQRERTPTIA